MAKKQPDHPLVAHFKENAEVFELHIKRDLILRELRYIEGTIKEYPAFLQAAEQRLQDVPLDRIRQALENVPPSAREFANHWLYKTDEYPSEDARIALNFQDRRETRRDLEDAKSKRPHVQKALEQIEAKIRERYPTGIDQPYRKARRRLREIARTMTRIELEDIGFYDHGLSKRDEVQFQLALDQAYIVNADGKQQAPFRGMRRRLVEHEIRRGVVRER